MWTNLGFPDEVLEWVDNSELLKMFRGFLFSRIVPTLKDIGLWGPRLTTAFTDMGVMDFAQTDIEALIADDEEQAERLDAERAATIAATVEVGAAS